MQGANGSQQNTRYLYIHECRACYLKWGGRMADSGNEGSNGALPLQKRLMLNRSIIITLLDLL